jgi:GT2 family glycosyltransferase
MTLVDIVIPTYNRHERLNRTLASLVRLTVRDFRVIVVDDGSTPGVDETIPADLCAVLDIRVLRTAGNGGPARARNLGLRASEAEFIAFIDDDVDAGPAWLEQHLAAVQGGEHRVSFGPLLAPPDWRLTPWNYWEAATLAAQYGKMGAGFYAPTWRQFFTGNALLRREDIVAAGGFDESFTRAEDIELGLRLHNLGCTFAFTPEANGWHYARRSLQSWLRIPREYARFDVTIDRAYPELDWMEVIHRERGQRRSFVRAVRRVCGAAAVQPLVCPALVAAGRVLFAARRRREASRAFSLVYDLEYGHALAEAEHATPRAHGSVASARPALD